MTGFPGSGLDHVKILAASDYSAGWYSYRGAAKERVLYSLKRDLSSTVRDKVVGPMFETAQLGYRQDAWATLNIESADPIVAWYGLELAYAYPSEREPIPHTLKPKLFLGTSSEKVYISPLLWNRGKHLAMNFTRATLESARYEKTLWEHYSDYLAMEMVNVLISANGHRHLYRLRLVPDLLRPVTQIRLDLVDIDDAAFQEAIEDAGPALARSS